MKARFSPAKINLTLRVTGQRTNGYHELHSLVLPLSVGDVVRLEVTSNPNIHLKLSGPRAAGLSNGPENLVHKAAALYLQAAGLSETHGANIELEKHLPLAAGLGGGSSNAAATLRLLHDELKAKIDLPALALKLGADVPFFLQDGAAWMTGVGEILQATECPPLWVVLCNPEVHISAAEAYAWREGPFSVPEDENAVLASLSGPTPLLHNDLTAGVLTHRPKVGEALAALEALGLRSPCMSGSGSTCFALAENEAEAMTAATALQQLGHWAAAAKG